MLLHEVEAEVEQQVDVLTQTEGVEQTSAAAVVTSVTLETFLLLETLIRPIALAVLVLTIDSPVVREANIGNSVVETSGMIATPPVGNVNHNVTGDTDVVELLLDSSILAGLVATQTHDSRLGLLQVNSTLHLVELTTETYSDDGREPLADKQVSLPTNAILEIEMLVPSRHHHACTAESLNEPVVLETIEGVALSRILNVGHLLSASQRGNHEHSTCKCHQSNLFHRLTLKIDYLLNIKKYIRLQIIVQI